jgi:hypothetical protein
LKAATLEAAVGFVWFVAVAVTGRVEVGVDMVVSLNDVKEPL